MASRRIEEHLEQLTALRSAPATEAVPRIRKALQDKSNLIIAKAAKIVAQCMYRELIPDLITAYDRLFVEPVKRDTQCWGKNAIAKALREMEYPEAAPFLRGARHTQLQPVWGGAEDTAGALRGVCLLALPGCSDIRREDILRFLVDALAESDPAVRADAARAIGAMGGDDSALLLRLKARMGDSEAPVTGQVFESLLALERAHALAFIESFLHPEGGTAGEEAVLAIGNSRLESGVDTLLRTLESATNEDFRGTILRALSISRHDRALAFLRDRAQEGDAAAKAALALFPDSGATFR